MCCVSFGGGAMEEANAGLRVCGRWWPGSYLDQVEETKCIYLHIGLHHFVKQRIGLTHTTKY
jgi:hypothetical protein